jgi:hypothetical protein
MAEISVIEQILNFVIPPAVFLLLFWIIYTAFKKPIDQMIDKFHSWRENRQHSEGGGSTRIQSIQYE